MTLALRALTQILDALTAIGARGFGGSELTVGVESTLS